MFGRWAAVAVGVLWLVAGSWGCAQDDDCADADGDGYLDAACEADPGDDCNDQDAAVYPGALEVCNGVDDDCDPGTDENTDYDGDAITACGGDCAPTDPDSVGYAPWEADDPAIDKDIDADGVTIRDGDCNDCNAFVYPGAPEIDDGLDDNCDSIED